MEQGVERSYFAGAPNVRSGSTLCHQAVESLTRIPPEGALDAIQAVITDGLPEVEATCDGMCPLQASCPGYQSVASFHRVGSRNEWNAKH